MNQIKKYLVGLVIFFTVHASFALQYDFYILNRSYYPTLSKTQVLPNLVEHFNSIHHLISQSYRIDAKGEVTGGIDPYFLKFAHDNKVKVLALVTNIGFDKDKAHLFLTNKAAQTKVIDYLVTACKENNLSGLQFDFEGVNIADKDALTAFFKNAADALHKNNLYMSLAVVPQTEGENSSLFLKRRFENWSGVYDLKSLGESVDSIAIMAYDQHTQGTTPGPNATIHWVESVIKYILQYVPANKVSLGIPVYSLFWSTGNTDGKPNGKLATYVSYLSYKEVNSLLNKLNSKLDWDDNNKLSYAIIEHNWLYEYLFVEEFKSFSAKLALAKKYNLLGISVFKLGSEDPKIWSILH